MHNTKYTLSSEETADYHFLCPLCFDKAFELKVGVTRKKYIEQEVRAEYEDRYARDSGGGQRYYRLIGNIYLKL